MTDALTPSIESALPTAELPEEQSFLQKCIETVRRIRVLLFGQPQTREQPKSTDFKVLNPEKILQIQRIASRWAEQWIDERDVIAIHELLKMAGAESQIEDFIEKNFRVVEDLNDLRDLTEKYNIPEGVVKNKRSVVLAAYLGRYLGRGSKSVQTEYKQGVGLGLNFINYWEKGARSSKRQTEEIPNIIPLNKAKDIQAQAGPKIEAKPKTTDQSTSEPKGGEDDKKVA